MPDRQQVYSAIDTERAYQDKLIVQTYGDLNAHNHSLEEFIMYMEVLLADAKKILSTVWGPKAQEQALPIVRKVTALGVAAMEEHGAPRREG